MATTIVTKSGSGAPTASDLVAGELAVDLTNKRLYTEDSGGTVLEVGSNPYNFTANHDGSAKLATTATGIDVTGSVTADGLTVANTAVIAGDFDGGTAATYIRLQDDTDNFLFGSNNSLGNFLIKNETADALRLSVANTGDVSFYEDTGTTPKFFWDASAQRLGLGTTSALADLHIVNSTAAQFLLEAGDSSTATILFGDSADTNIGWIQYDNSDNNMNFRTNNTERMRIDSSGSVGIGTSSPSQKLTLSNGTFQINGSSSFSGNVEIGRVDGDNNMAFATGGTERMRIDSSGNLLVGTTSTVAGGKISVQAVGTNPAIAVQGASDCFQGRTTQTSGTSYFAYWVYNGSNVGSITSTGSSTAYNTSSDQRLKENIADADDAGSKIDSIQVRQYDWKADGSHQDYGMVAQELQLVAPEAVTGDADSEEMMGVDYSKLVPMLIKEIQSLRNRIAALES